MVGGVGMLVHATPRTLAGLRQGQPAEARHLARGARGLADPLRLHRRRRARHLRGRADRVGHRAAARAGDARRARPRGAAAGRRHRRPGRAAQGAGCRAQGRAAARARA
nr:hypothetical protein [Angustibacter aerolatus]